MSRQCLRCTEKLKDEEQTLCKRCEKAIGKRPSLAHHLCDFCGFDWIFKNELMCKECLKKEECAGPIQ